MRTVLAVCVFLAIAVSASFAQAKKAVEAERKSIVKIDTALIRKLHADDYGMKKYVMAFLKAGPKRDQDSVTAAKLQGEHMKNIQRLANLGKLVLAGPFLDGNEFRGIYIFNVETVEEAKELTESDPAIKAGRLVMELHPWYGSAALQKLTELHRRIQSRSF